MIGLVTLGLGLHLVSGVPGIFAGRRAAWPGAVAAALAMAGSACGLAGAKAALFGSGSEGLDALAGWFLVPVFVVGAAASVYGWGYWTDAGHPGSAAKVRLLLGVLVAAMGGVVAARGMVPFLVAWEVMALAAFFLVTAEDRGVEVRVAGRVYLGAAHAGLLCLVAAAVLVGVEGAAFGPEAKVPTGWGGAVLMLGVAGFGMKAGLMPVHVWLPGAHGNAPSHVSALMSGVMIKMGVYGLLRVSQMVPDAPLWWGGGLLALGAFGAVMGMASGLGQGDVKRLLAYCTIENAGVLAVGLGLALGGRSMGRGDLVVLGLGALLFHVWNHALFKALLFFAAGAVAHATGTREMDRLGGLARRMPGVAALFFVGSLAICCVPPLNGFAGKLPLYVGLFRAGGAGAGGDDWPLAALAAPALAMAGALSVAAFCRAYGSIFSGVPRSSDAVAAHDPPLAMLLPMAAMAGACVAAGLVPWALGPALDRAVWAWGVPAGGARFSELAPLREAGGLACALWGACGVVGLWAWVGAHRAGVSGGPTWDCGYSGASARVQYTGSSFAQMALDLFGWGVPVRDAAPRVDGLFPGRSGFDRRVGDVVLDRVVWPGLAWAERLAMLARPFHCGRVHIYILYILATVVGLMAWAR